VKRLAILLLAVVLSGCGTYVQVRHPWVLSRVGVPDLPGLGSMYVVLDRYGSEIPVGFAGKTAVAVIGRALGANENAAVTRPLSPAEETGILWSISAGMAGPWIGLAGCSVKDASTTGFLEEIRPSTVLEIRPGLLEARQAQAEVVVRDYMTNEAGRRMVYRLLARFEADYVLREWPSGREITRGRLARETGGDSPDPVYLAEWLDSLGALREYWLRDLYRDLAPIPVLRTRRVREQKKPGPLESEWNAGIDSEKTGDWTGARAHYSTALTRAEKNDDRQELQSYIYELDRLAPNPTAAAVPAIPGLWSGPVAVLPFANDTNNVSAPEDLRKIAASRLALMGYRVVPLETTDRGLQAKGVTQGEQLRSLKPGDIPAAAGAGRVIGGLVEVFSVVNVGIYYKREVRVRLWMSDASGVHIWESTGTGYLEVASDRPAETFILGLVGKVGEKVTKTYLKEEGTAAIMGSLGTLPARYSR